MIFKPELCQAIVDGRKTQTRRLARGWRDWWGYDENGAICCVRLGGHNRMTWRVGNTYAIQPRRDRKAIGYFSITAIHRERLQDITPAGILAEGIDNLNSIIARPRPVINLASVGQLRHEFVALWNSINTKKGTRWTDNPEVWVLTFELVANSLRGENSLT